MATRKSMKDLAAAIPGEAGVANPAELAALAARIRLRIIEMCHRSRTAHLGSALSCVDILTVAAFAALRLDPSRPDDPDRDRLLLSKGHAAPALFATLAARGFFPDSLLDSYAQPGSCLEEHPGPGCAPGVEAASGSLGHGLGLGLGMALAAGLRGAPTRVMVVLSDGECNEGSVWEAAMLASGRCASNLTAVIDFNKWQATDRSCQVMGLEPLAEKWRAFGWDAVEVDGHDMASLLAELSKPGRGKPKAVVAHTIKGKGVSFMEDDNNWHYRTPKDADLARAREELGPQAEAGPQAGATGGRR